MNDPNFIRNFCIIAHIDHGKSTLADRFLELTKTVPQEKMRPQYLDQMGLERERGITIKMAPVRMIWNDNILNLIDTPGHVDFSYEVSRALAATEGAILLVDATKGVQAQTLANWQLAKKEGLTIIPVINKIDSAGAEIEKTRAQITEVLGIAENDIYSISAKTGEGVSDLLDAVVEKIPAPQSHQSAFRALIFDSFYDTHRGVIIHIRVIDGEVSPGETVHFYHAKLQDKVLEAGIFSPAMKPMEKLGPGEIGYLVTGLKSVGEVNVGETITKFKNQNAKCKINDEIHPLPGYQEPRPMVYANFFVANNSAGDYQALRMALEKLKLNDASLKFSPFHSPFLGIGFRCGFMGILHLDIIKERLKREFNLDVFVTPPSVVYQIKISGQPELKEIYHPSELPENAKIEFFEPWAKVEIITPLSYYGQIIKILESKRGRIGTSKPVTTTSDVVVTVIRYLLPLAEVITDLNDKIKSVSAGYGSLAYEFDGYQPADLARLDIALNHEIFPAFSQIVANEKIQEKARLMAEKLAQAIPKQMIEVKIQAKTGGKIIASERISALRKDVTAKLYGGDVTRKRKLWEKQKKGKKKMKLLGRVQVPDDIFLKII